MYKLITHNPSCHLANSHAKKWYLSLPFFACAFSKMMLKKNPNNNKSDSLTRVTLSHFQLYFLLIPWAQKTWICFSTVLLSPTPSEITHYLGSIILFQGMSLKCISFYVSPLKPQQQLSCKRPRSIHQLYLAERNKPMWYSI